MLSSDVLSQLSTLKKEIRANKDTAQGTVRGTSGRYGFVTLDDGRDAFLNPEQMDRLFHGDRIEVEVTQNEKEQYEAKVEKLIHSPLKQLAGRYCIKGKGHFIIYETQQYSRWVFVPPKARANAKDGHYVTGRIIQHPFENGKAQAKITQNIGLETDINTARQYSLAMFQLFENFPKDVLEQTEQLQQQPILQGNDSRKDLRQQPFITIDSANTKDMDDALSIEATKDGWQLAVAIANPSSEIPWDSPLDTIASRRGQTIYFPGKPVPMLPETLSTERYSLISGEERLALVCHLSVNHSGEVASYHFEEAVIQSHAKLSYTQVAALLKEQPYKAAPQLDDASPFKEQLLTLKRCADALHQYRANHQLVTDNKSDTILILNGQGTLASIETVERTLAHTIVEEAMIATNQAAGHFLAQHSTPEKRAGLFMVHPGYRDERREDIEKLLAEKLGEQFAHSTQELVNYISNIRQLQSDDSHASLLAIQLRFNQGSEPSSQPGAHFGLGAQYYATITSPIRRYQDLYNQRVIQAILHKQTPRVLKSRQIEKLKESNGNSRSASRFIEQWLIADYMEDKIGQVFDGYIALLTNQGVGIRLLETEIEGFVAGKKENKDKPEEAYDKISFNNQRMELTWNDKPLYLEQKVQVKLVAVDGNKKKLAFEWTEAQ